MQRKKEFTITIDQLVSAGYERKQPDGINYVWYEKVLAEPVDEENEGITMSVEDENGYTRFKLYLPDGTWLNIGPYTIEELLLFEQMVLGWEPNY